MLRRIARTIPPLRKTYGALREFSRRNPLSLALYQTLFEYGRLTLPRIDPEVLGAETAFVKLPAHQPLFAGEDTPLNDLLFLLSVAKGRDARRILEVGTYRGRSTFAFHLNCPEAKIVSYDIQVMPSSYRTELEKSLNVELRHQSFRASADPLRNEPPFDFVFIDGAHDVDSVCEDSRLAFEVVDPGGIIIWHDYRHNGYFTNELRVPEALERVREGRQLFHVRGTTCAIYCPRWPATR
jgi:predicted O-methyltransferase YrrM